MGGGVVSTGTDEVVIPFDENVKDNAVLLLAAAEDLGLHKTVVRTTEGSFIVSKEIHDKAFGKPEPEPKREEAPKPKAEPPAEAVPKKTTTKKGD